MVSIATGLWYDYSQPTGLSATLTISAEDGGYLLSALTYLVTLAGTSFWNITAFFLHRRMVKGSEVSAIDLQHQVILRNTSSPGDTLWYALKILRSWKGIVPKLFRKSCRVAIPAALVFAGFGAASILTSKVTNKSYTNVAARVRPERCGFWLYSDDENGLAARNTKILNDTVQARTYMTSFYANSSISPTTRSLFRRASLPFNTSTTAPCPIPDAQRCSLGHSGAFSMTTDHLDSHTMLGINDIPANRVTVQISVTCSPLSLKGLANPTHISNSTFLAFNLGPAGGDNVTYLYNIENPGTGATYILDSRVANARNPKSNWVPIPSFNRSDADISLFFLSQNSMVYSAPVFDPWFSANGTYTRKLNSTGTTFYLPDYLVNTMVCADQYVFCNPSSGLCSSLNGILGTEEAITTLNTPSFNPAQLATAGRISLALVNTGTFDSVSGLGPAALFARNLLFDNISAGMPDSQWRTEVLGWFQTSLAKLQSYMVEFATNSADLGIYGSVKSPNTFTSIMQAKALQDQCSSQLVEVAGEVQNFSFLGVMIIVCVSVVIILVDWSLESIVDFVNRWRKRDSQAVRARRADGLLHLLRMALAAPTGAEHHWKAGKSDSVPILEDCNKPFARPDPNNEDLPTYAREMTEST